MSVAADLARFAEPGAALNARRVLWALYHSRGLVALIVYRLGRWLTRAAASPLCWPVLPAGWLVYFIVSTYVRTAYDIQLSLSAEIGGGMHIDHFGDIVVRDCRIGTGCSIRQGVHIEPAADGSPPTIADHVWIGANAKIVGPFRIGDGGTISAGSIVDRNVPAQCVYVGSLGRVVLGHYDNRRLHESIYVGV